MTRWKNIFFNISIALNCLLAFLLFFSDKLVVPAWLQVGGRMHPLILHFPIVIIVLYVLWLLLSTRNSNNEEIGDNLLLLASVSAVVTALCGLLLSKEPGYDADALQTHKWAGCISSFLLLFWYWASSVGRYGRWLHISASFVVLLLIVIAGDLGGDITHGDNFLLAPINPAKQRPQVPFEEAFVYADLVQPVLDEKCLSCHNSKKAKGELIMETADLLFKGGKDGKLWDTARADLGLLMQRIHLPEEEKEHMPPTGKPQLTEEEIIILHSWIKAGADANKKVADLLPTDTLRVIAYKKLKATTEEHYDFAAADKAKIKKLTNTNRVIYPVALNSPALVVNFYNAPFFDSKQLQELDEVKQQIVELNLSKMPVKDGDLKIISGFPNLRILNLNYSAITGSALSELKKLPVLKSLSLAGTSVNAKQLEPLQTFPKLKSVFIWNTGINDKMIAKANPAGKIKFETGYKGDTVVLKLTPPVVVNEQAIFTHAEPVQLKHYINGTTIRYTTDGSDPDSTSSTVYKNDLLVKKGFLLKARAVKPGWYSSDVITQYFYTSHYVPDSVELVKPADVKYAAKGGRTIADLVKSDMGSNTGKWLGFRNNDLEAMMYFNQPVYTSSVTFSMLKDINGFIFPPTSVEVWGGSDKNKMKLLSRNSPKPPVKGEPNENIAIVCNFDPVTISCLKIVAKPLAKLPAWHQGKGEKAWIFIDEVLVN